MKAKNRVSAIILSLIIIFACCLPVCASDEKPFENSAFFTYGKYTLHYRTFTAENEKDKIMMIHGFGCSTSTWEPIAKQLREKGYTCVLVDLPGFGYSTRETEIADEDAIDREKMVIALMKSIAETEDWIVAGHSMGGGVAMNIACLEPQIKGLMLFCPCPIAELSGSLADMMSSKLMGTMANFIFEKMTKVTPLLRMVAYFAFMDWEFTKNYDLSIISAPLQIHNTGYSNMITSARAMPNDFEKIKALDMPTLLVQADKDMVLNSSMKNQVNSALASAEAYTVEGGGHLCIENRSDELTQVICDFLK